MSLSTARLLAALHDDAGSAAMRPPGAAVVTLLPTPGSDAASDAAVSRTLAAVFLTHPFVQHFTLIGDSASWTQSVVEFISHRLPPRIKVYTREVVDRLRNRRARITMLFYQGEPFLVSHLALQIDEVDEEVAAEALSLPVLSELVLRASRRCSSVDALDVTVRFLKSFSSLVVATVTVTTDEEVNRVLQALQINHPGLTRLALLMPANCETSKVTDPIRIRLENAIIQGLECFTQLEHLVLDEGLKFPLLNEALGRLPRLQHLTYIAGPFSVDSEAEVSRILRSTFLD